MMRRSAGRWVGAVVGSLVVAACSNQGATTNTTPSTFGAPIGSAPPTSSPAIPPSSSRVCAPAPGAQCSNADSFNPPVVPGIDLTGIDLRGATLGEDIDLSDAVLNGAHLDAAKILGTLRGADLTGASLVGADLSETDLSRATLTGATLTGAGVNATLFDADDLPTAIRDVTVGIRSGETLSGTNLSGLDLTGVRFTSRANGIAPMAGARFRGATLTGASFHRVDLTGADFSDAVFAADGGPEPTFTETTCPDFLPSDPSLTGRAACRL